MIFSDLQNQLNAVRAISEESCAALKIARQKMKNIKRKKDLLVREIAAKDRASDERLKAITHDETKFTKAVNVGKTTYAGALMNEWAKLNEFLQFVDPIQNISNLEDDYPILLFPLRLETRFKKVESNGETVDQLWVRVFPDEISIDSFESDLSDAEIRNARSYWLARWKAGKDVDGNRGAWRSLASARGPGRAFWLTNNYVPLNLADEPEKVEGEIILAIGTEDVLTEPELGTIITYWQTVWKAGTDNVALSNAWNKLVSDVEDEERAKFLVKVYKPSNISDIPPVGLTREQTTVRVEFVVFPKTDEMETKLHAWSQPPATTILPERFVFLAYQDGEQAISQLGNLVPPKLIMGPDPAAEEGEDFRLATQDDADINPSLHEGDLIFSENMRWMFDFDEAVAKGMGFKIDLTSEQAESGFERVFVLGVKLSADAERGQGLLEELFQHHQYSRKGMSIIRQGTPTNNTEENGSGYSWRHDSDDSFDIYFGESDDQTDPTDWFSKCDGRWMAELLGIDPEKLRTIENYYATDICEAKAMQQALWPATMGHFMDSMMNPVFSKDVIEHTRDFFTRYVSGRGNLPTIRVGKQPYGILPATNYTHMGWFKPKQQPHTPSSDGAMYQVGGNFLPSLYRILLDMDQTWGELQNKVAYLGKEGDPHQILLDIVGLHPDSVELYKRYGNSLKQIHNIYNVWGFSHNSLFEYYPTSYVAAATLLKEYGYSIDKINPEPDILKKSFFSNAFILKGDRIDKVPDSEINPIGPYTPDGKNYIRWLIEASEQSHDRLRIQDGFANDKPPTALLYLLLYHALDLSYIDTSLKLHLSKGVFDEEDVRRAYIEPDFIHIEEGNETESRWKYLYKTEEAITGDPYVQLGQYIPQHIDELNEAAVFRDVLAGLKKLEHVPTARLERLLMEHIDTVSYRYDAWMLGYLHLQLEQMRGLENSGPDSSPKRGVYLGAYGWLEDLRPENKELAPVSLPDELNEVFNPQSDLVEDVSNAGYILAPSVNHAVTAAVLRNGHLSNDSPEDKEELKIKLSSNRVRLALQIIEGIQGGQSLSALLGYQFERGLHDSAIAEVDAFIFDLRNAFPLVAKKFKETTPAEGDPDYKSIDQIEAKNVIDGVAFLEHIEKTGIKTYPFDLGNSPHNFDMQHASPDQQRAINQAVLKLIELNDAVADLAMAESVHQAVMGNYERAAATLDTYSKGNFPPTPDVVQTPRSGFQLTHRVALQFKSGLSNSLNDAGVTPRMAAEPAIHDWLKGIMPDVDDIVCVIRYIGSASGVETKRQISLSDLGLAHIDALYLLNIDSDQVMSALDDLIMHYALTDLSLHMDQDIVIEHTSKIDSNKITVFEMTSLIASLRALILKSKSLTAADVKLSNEAAKENEQSLNFDPTRVQPVITALADLRTNMLAPYITDLATIIATTDNTLVRELDRLMNDISAIFIKASRYGIPQTGIGFIYQWQQSMYTRLGTKIDELITRWEGRSTEYETLRGVLAGSALPDEEKFTLLAKAELKISSQPTIPRPPALEKYFEKINGTPTEAGKWQKFQGFLNNTIKPIRDTHGLSNLIQRIQTMASQLAPFDIIGINIEDELKQVNIFANDMKNAANNLSKEMMDCETKVSDFLAGANVTSDPLKKVEQIQDAAKAIFGDNFVMVPEFTLDEAHGTEWQNTLASSDRSLRYLQNDMDMDFPMDDWLYGVSRVREKLYHVENVLMHIEGFTDDTLSLIPSQFPYRDNDYWIGMQFPEKKDDTEEPFTIDEDKLLFTSIYSEPFDPTKLQCGLLLDEWTEVIPSKDETLGLSFHYDQPNSEPPQTLLLTTPSNFTGSWQWEDLANTLHEALDMAKKRAVEPDHVDTTVYSRFLPPIVSLASPLPLTAMLNLALNNNVFFSKVSEDE